MQLYRQDRWTKGWDKKEMFLVGEEKGGNRMIGKHTTGWRGNC
jgi:hypothetical protein